MHVPGYRTAASSPHDARAPRRPPRRAGTPPRQRPPARGAGAGDGKTQKAAVGRPGPWRGPAWRAARYLVVNFRPERASRDSRFLCGRQGYRIFISSSERPPRDPLRPPRVSRTYGLPGGGIHPICAASLTISCVPYGTPIISRAHVRVSESIAAPPCARIGAETGGGQVTQGSSPRPQALTFTRISRQTTAGQESGVGECRSGPVGCQVILHLGDEGEQLLLRGRRLLRLVLLRLGLQR